MARLPPPKNAIASTKTGIVTPEWLDWLLGIADQVQIGGGGGAGGGSGDGGQGGQGGVTIVNNYGSGTPDVITKWTAPQTLGDSIMTESNGIVRVDGTIQADRIIATQIIGTLPEQALPVHAPTHEAGGTDPLKLDNLAPPDNTTDLNSTVGRHGLLPRLSGSPDEFLNGLGQWVDIDTGVGAGEVWVGASEPPVTVELWYDPTTGELKARIGDTWEVVSGGAPDPHAPTHAAGGTDPVNVTGLAGYPGGTTDFLRADGTFAAPPGGGGGGMNLDYLGTYAPGPVYNDGDIVVGPDNILYMCVVDGTTTPPEPWPGVGAATAVGPPGPQGPPGEDAAIVADATYWTVSPHPELVNERALNALANGYVKSTTGEPSTVAIIPVAEGGTSANNAASARTNLGCGTVATQNYNGSAATFLRGDGVWAAPPVEVPSGMIAMFATACPAGWTRLGGWDGRFPRAMPTYGSYGGSSNHYHLAGALVTASHSHSAGTYAGPNHNHGGSTGTVSVSISGTTGGSGSHSHSVGLHFSTGTASAGSTQVDAGGGPFVTPNHTHNLDQEITTGSGGDHTHSFSGSGGGTGSISNDGGQGISGTSGAAAPAVTGNTDWATDHYPPYFDVVFCQKD